VSRAGAGADGTIDPATLDRAVGILAAADPDLGGIVARHGSPPLWPREPGFGTLALLILEQQVSLASARAAFGRLEAAVGVIAEVGPAGVLAAGESRLIAAGLTRQKSRYLVALAAAVDDGRLDLDALDGLDDDAVRDALTAVPGIGRWTADCYLLFALRRPDVWPPADIALAAAVQFVGGLPARPDSPELERIAEAWRPWRSVAARLLWHAYLSGDRPPRAGRASPLGAESRAVGA
jgi:DNA-3-methyladenine glycosylase II